MDAGLVQAAQRSLRVLTALELDPDTWLRLQALIEALEAALEHDDAAAFAELLVELERLADTRGVPSFHQSTGWVGVEQERVTRSMLVKLGNAQTASALEVVDLHLRATLGHEVSQGVVTTVAAVVSREALGLVPGANSGIASGEAIVGRPVTIQVMPRLNFTVEGEDRFEIPLPDAGAERLLLFDLMPVEAGPGEVWIVARQNQLPLAVVKLAVTIIAPGTPRDTKLMTVEQGAVVAPAAAAALSTFEVSESRVGDEVVYEYQLVLPELGVMRRFRSDPIRGSRDTYVAGLYRQLEEWAKRPPDPSTLLEDVRAFGAELFDQLFPRELQALLWEHRDRLRNIMVLSTEPFIPWELVHLKPPGEVLPDEPCFLGEFGLVRWLWGSYPPISLPVRAAAVRHVIPKYGADDLPETAKERHFLETELGASAIEPTVPAVRSALASPGFDILHFAGHARADGGDVSGAQLILQDYNPLFATTVRQHARFATPDRRPLIVLNACQSGRSAIGLTQLGGFAEAFLERKAGALVTTLWAVGDVPARTFTEAFYGALRQNMTFAEATTAARRATRSADDPTWLAYVVYAHPHAQIAWNA